LRLFSHFLYQVLILRVFELIFQLIEKNNEEEALENMQVLVFCLDRTWAIMDSKFRDQIRIFLEITETSAKTKELKEISSWEWSEKLHFQDLIFNNKFQVLLKVIIFKSSVNFIYDDRKLKEKVLMKGAAQISRSFWKDMLIFRNPSRHTLSAKGIKK